MCNGIVHGAWCLLRPLSMEASHCSNMLLYNIIIMHKVQYGLAGFIALYVCISFTLSLSLSLLRVKIKIKPLTVLIEIFNAEVLFREDSTPGKIHHTCTCF